MFDLYMALKSLSESVSGTTVPHKSPSLSLMKMWLTCFQALKILFCLEDVDFFSGDNEAEGQRIGRSLGIAEVKAGLTPQGKLDAIASSRERASSQSEKASGVIMVKFFIHGNSRRYFHA